MSEQSEKFDCWGIAEVMGHKKFAGRITEQTIAGAALVRVDVPAVTKSDGREQGAFTKLIGVGSIYCITPTSEDLARKAAARLATYDTEIIPVYIPEERQLPAGVTVGGGDDDFDDDDEDLDEDLDEDATGSSPS
jgi:hypothetical protein